ncbi:hypothetical protein EDD30_7381 [Couchioplanes caeruleus]|uniref:Uncharacterized protein n=1 Tax=Couchioplanes caeruleus TaxID=56438 RepID=A0A3N1GVJ8_9ACTN|nr:hypothetical protein EDD30_7381 [Couchioplanes caeruleus]
MLSTPSAAAFSHQVPRGSVRLRAIAIRPAGSARITAANSGWSGGRSSVVTTYVVPHTMGATAVTVVVRSLTASRLTAPQR